jgi:Zn2+/Cd2+-exporting ATPase
LYGRPSVNAVAIAAVFPWWLTLWLTVLGVMGASALVTLNGMRLLAAIPVSGVKPE